MEVRLKQKKISCKKNKLLLLVDSKMKRQEDGGNQKICKIVLTLFVCDKSIVKRPDKKQEQDYD